MAQANNNDVAPHWIIGRRYEAVGAHRFLHNVQDIDGLRFALAHSEVSNTLRNDLFASTVAVDGVQLLAQESRVPLWTAASNAFSPAVCGQYGASLGNSRAACRSHDCTRVVRSPASC